MNPAPDDELDLHPVSEAERLEAYRNVHDVWGQGLPLEEHVRRRLASVQHNRARWYVGCTGGRVATSLACYPLAFHYRGGTVKGIAIGSVHTASPFRGRGYAPRLIRWVEEQQRNESVVLSLLYSDIGPEYYARLGYLLCPAWEGWREPQSPPEAPARLERCDPREHRDAMAELYAAYHHASGIAVARTPAYWEHLLERHPDDEHYWLVDRDARRGYARLAVEADEIRIRDYALADDAEATAEALYRAIIALAGLRGAARCGGWLPDRPAARRLFSLQPRDAEITMLKPLTDEVQLDVQLRAATDRFCELDHV